MEKDNFNNMSENKNKHFILGEITEEKVLEIITTTCGKVLKCLKDNENTAMINLDINPDLIKNLMPIGKFPTIGDKESINKSLDLILTKSKVPNFNSPNYFGHMLPTTTIHSLVANNIATLLNQNIIAEEVGPVFTHMENVVISYLADLIGYDINQAGGSMVSGGTTANHTALIVARNKILPDVTELGISESLEVYNKENETNYKKAVILHGDESHYSIEKLGGYIGMGTKNMIKIPYIEGKHKLDLEELEQLIDKCEKNGELIVSIIVTAGTTEKGHVQDIKGVNKIAKKGQNNRPIHFHVDAAHGGGFLVNQKLRETIFEGIEDADSVTIDGHKMLYTSYNSGGGGIVFKDKNSMNYIKHSAHYVIPENSDDDNHGANTIEGSRGASGVYQLYSNINSFGKEGYNELFQKLLDNKEYLIKTLKEKADDYEILSNDAELNLVCFRYKNEGKNEVELNEINNQLKKELDDDGTYFVSTTTIDGKKTFRLVFMNPKTEKENIDGFLNKVSDILKTITN